MRDGSMFGKLIQYRYEDHMRKHPYAYLKYGNGTERYEVIAAFFYDTTKDRLDYTTATTKEISTFLSERTLYQKVFVTEQINCCCYLPVTMIPLGIALWWY